MSGLRLIQRMVHRVYEAGLPSTACCSIYTVRILVSTLRKCGRPTMTKPLCGIDHYQKNDVKTGDITVQISSDTASSIQLCKIQVFAKDDKWCLHPPEKSVPNGQLEVSRHRAVLRCNVGFKEKDGREVYATCENNKWSYLSLQCVVRLSKAPLVSIDITSTCLDFFLQAKSIALRSLSRAASTDLPSRKPNWRSLRSLFFAKWYTNLCVMRFSRVLATDGGLLAT
ncbi:hypothetical protein AVEN_242884-1 [Araneus ventricosus]|uniref:Sushi domain-containing protein n=1 Tax=Araneus ventricosus TaxID=182803 RepID=A0A4Y2TYQ1_ARAVE|nr:hypothetical protein AVEN_242884-1 [Araneus ventricosus]